ncbi:MAG: efflux RND transporter periplasmic adaptor subunit [Alphaproteobacteria bacterium]
MGLLKKYISIEKILIVLAIFGALGGGYMVMKDRERPPVAQPIMAPAFAPYDNYIAASGIIEAYGSNTDIGTFGSGVVNKIIVNQGDFVQKGDPLFILDQRQAQADLEIKKAALRLAKSSLNQTQVDLKNKKHLYNLIQKVQNKGAVSQEDIITRRDNMLLAEAAVQVAESSIKSAEADLKSSELNLELLTVRAPADGEVLQVNINEGEFVTDSNTLSTPPVLFGGVSKYQIRIEIDENDAWKFKPGARATAYLRGNTSRKIPVEYDHFEPYVVPKSQLTGSPQEKIDVRVLQVVYTYDPKDFASYIGQQLDVYIEVPK